MPSPVQSARRTPPRKPRAATKKLRELDAQEDWILDKGRRGQATKAGTERALERLKKERAEVERQEQAARVQIEVWERHAELSVSLAARLQSLRAGLERDRSDFAAWRELVEILFPRDGQCGVAIWPDGRIQLRGAVTLDAAGEEALRRARGKASRPSRGEWSIPVVLGAYARR